MIIVQLKGGLGNQMFQYATGLHLSVLRKTELKLDTSFFNIPGNYTQRHYELDVFGIKATLATAEEITSFRSTSSWRYARYLQRKFPYFFNKAYIAESGHAYHPLFVHYPKNTYLEGFWQSEKYFSSIAPAIRNTFSFKEPLNEANAALAERIKTTASVSIHVRRGDYISNPIASGYHGICEAPYYQNAIKYLQAKHSDIHVFIFSDDLEWVKQNLKFDLPAEYINHNTGSNSHIDMQLMSLCKHNVIANSSFSWWGAWLNTNPAKIVIAPANWFTDKATDWSDVYAKSWIIQ